MKIKLSHAMMVILILSSNVYSSQKVSDIMEEERYGWGEPYLKNFSDFRGWIKGFFFRETTSIPQKEKQRNQFEEAGRAFIEKISFFDKDVKEKFLEGKRFIVSQDADHPELLRSLSIWDSEKKLKYIKEESIGKSGKKIYYFDSQADVSYWKKKGKWYVQAPYVFGYHKECYETREALEKRLHSLFEKRVNSYAGGDYEILSQGNKGFIIKKTKGFFIKQTLETAKASNIYEVHQFLLDRERDRYTSYLYEGEDPSAKFKSLGLIALMLGAGMVDSMNMIKWETPDANSKVFHSSQSYSTEGSIAALDSLLFTTLTFATPKLLPLYFLMKVSESLGVKGQEVYCEDGVCGFPSSSCSQNEPSCYFDQPKPSQPQVSSLIDYTYCANLMRNITANNLEPNKDFPCTNNVIFFLGNTRVGKGVFTNYLAGKKITAIENGLDIEVQVEQPITEVGHGVESKTFKPVLWKSNDLCYYDTPGLGETRGADHDIIKASFLQQLGNTAQSLRLVLVAEETSLEGAATGFLSLMKGLEGLVGKEGVPQLHDATSFIITKSQASLKNIRAQLTKIKNNPGSHLSPQIQNFLQSLLQNDKIRSFEKIKPIDEFGGINVLLSPQQYIDFIKNTNSISSQKKPHFNMVVDPKTSQVISQCSQFFNEGLKESVERLAKNFEYHYASIIEEKPLNATSVQSWHSFFDKTRKEEMDKIKKPQELFTIFNSVAKTLKIIDTPERNTTSQLQILKRDGEDLDLLSTFKDTTVQYTPAVWVSGINPLIKNLDQLSNVHSKKTIIERKGNIFSVQGFFPSMSEVSTRGNSADIRIYGLHTFWLDSALTVPRGILSIIAPDWTTNDFKQVIINLTGLSGENYLQATNGSYGTGENGNDGLPGRLGQSGGHFLAMGDHFFNLTADTLRNCISVNGGKGGNGQQGGNGGKGRSGADANDSDMSLEESTGWKDWNTHLQFYHKKYRKYGAIGGKGGMGGKGGEGGYGGYPGTLEINGNIKKGTEGVRGNSGERGGRGEGGEGGRSMYGEWRVMDWTDQGIMLKACAHHPITFVGCLAPYLNLKSEMEDKTKWVVGPYLIDERQYKGSMGDEASQDKNSQGIVKSTENKLNYNEIINEYKLFLRKHLSDLSKEEYKNNMMMQAQKGLLEIFLKNIENNPEVKKKVIL